MVDVKVACLSNRKRDFNRKAEITTAIVKPTTEPIPSEELYVLPVRRTK